MDAVRAGIGLGLGFVPVPGLQPAFELLCVIWDNVQKASRNKTELLNLARACGEVFITVNELLKEGRYDNRVGKKLSDLNGLMKEFLEFTEKHLNMNAFIALLKSSDVEGEIQSFQHRVQFFWLGFDLAAHNATHASQHDIQEQLKQVTRLLLQNASIKSSLNIPKPKIHGDVPSPGSSPKLFPKLSATTRRKMVSEVEENKAVMIEASFDKPSNISINHGGPVITTKYGEKPLKLAQWGMNTAGSKVLDANSGFNIVISNDPKVYEWRIYGKVIFLAVVDPEHPEIHNAVDIVFSSFTLASSWFTYLKEYAAYGRSEHNTQDVLVRRRFHCWMKKSKGTIMRSDPPNNVWYPRVYGHKGSACIYPTHLSYASPGALTFATIYRSGSTIVREHFQKMQDEFPISTSRTKCNSEEEAIAWYEAFQAVISGSHEKGLPVRVNFSNTYTAVLERNSVDGKVVLNSLVWPSTILDGWGLTPGKDTTITTSHNSFIVSNATTSWSWRVIHERITAYTKLALQPDWYGNLEIVFPDSQISARWFEQLSSIALGSRGTPNPLPSLLVTVKQRSIIWLYKDKGKVFTHEAFAGVWRSILGSTFLRYEHKTASSFLGSSSVKGLPKLNVYRDGRTLVMRRDPGAGVEGQWVTRHYIFPSEEDAEEWYNHCKKDAIKSSK